MSEHENLEPEATVVTVTGAALTLASLAILLWAYGTGAALFGLLVAAGVYLTLVGQYAREDSRARRRQDA